MKVKCLIFSMLILLLFLAGCSNVSQTDYYNVQNDLNRAQKKIDNQAQEISELTASNAALEKQVSVLEEQLETLHSQLNTLQTEYNSYKDKMAEYEQLAEAEAVIKAEQEAAPTNENVIPLGDSCIVSIKPHSVRNGSSSKTLFTIGLGEVDSKIVSSISSDDLDIFIARISELTEFNSIVLCFEDGTGIVFNNSTSSFTNDYGFIDVSNGNFEITERLGALWKKSGKWVYMTEQEMIAADEAGL